MRRPGRFDYHIEVPYPDREGRAAILRVFLAKMKTRRGLRIEALAEETEHFSGAELAVLCREAGLHAIHRGLARGIPARKLVVSGLDFRQALAALRAKRVPDGPWPDRSGDGVRPSALHPLLRMSAAQTRQ